MGKSAIEDELKAAGPGSQGIVFSKLHVPDEELIAHGLQPTGHGKDITHMTNVRYTPGGTFEYFDGQSHIESSILFESALDTGFYRVQ